MDYLLNRYLFVYLPFEVSEEWRNSITSVGMTTLKVADWFCKTQDLWNFYSNHASFLMSEILFPLLCLLTLVHACRHSARYVYAWLGITFYALIMGCFCFAHEIFNYQWHAQGLLTFFGGRAPLSALFGIHQFAIYVAYLFVSRMHLPLWAQGPATSIGTLLIKLPYYIIGNKLLWWTWHSSDPLLSDKIYGVPWIAFAFDIASVNAFVWGLKLSRKIVLKDFYDWKKFGREFTCALSAAISAFFVGIAQTALLVYLNNFTGIPLYLIALAFISANSLTVYIADRRNRNPDARTGNHYWFDELSLAVCTHFIFLMFLILVSAPGNVVSPGMHQPIGPCNAYTKFSLPFGKVIEKGTYLCVKGLDSTSNFNFNCIPGVAKGKPPKFGSDIVEWYAICGVPMNAEQHAEYIGVIWSFCLIASAILYQAAANSGKTPRIFSVIYRSPISGISKKKN